MGETARVKSIDALLTMLTALECFNDDGRSAMDDLDLEIRRALQWIGEDCRVYWKEEVKRSYDRVTERKVELERAMMVRHVEGQRASCIEEKKALEKAKHRLAFAQSRVEAVRHWTVTIERAVNELMARRTNFAGWFESDFPKAIAALQRMIASLDSYLRLQTPSEDVSAIVGAATAPTSDVPSAARSSGEGETGENTSTAESGEANDKAADDSSGKPANENAKPAEPSATMDNKTAGPTKTEPST